MYELAWLACPSLVCEEVDLCWPNEELRLTLRLGYEVVNNLEVGIWDVRPIWEGKGP
jgi:hypothetical protein